MKSISKAVRYLTVSLVAFVFAALSATAADEVVTTWFKESAESFTTAAWVPTGDATVAPVNDVIAVDASGDGESVTYTPVNTMPAGRIDMTASIDFGSAYDTAPTVPEGSKIGLVLVKTTDGAEFYYLDNEGAWAASAVAATPNETVEVGISYDPATKTVRYFLSDAEGAQPIEVTFGSAVAIEAAEFQGAGSITLLQADAAVPAIAKIDTTLYPSVDAAIAVAESTDVIELLADAEIVAAPNGTFKIKKGDFKLEIPAAFLNKWTVADDVTTYEFVKDGKFVAQVSGFATEGNQDKFFSFAAAQTAMAANATLTLLEDVDGAKDQPWDKAGTLALNGKTYNYVGVGGYVFVVTAAMTIEDTENGEIVKSQTATIFQLKDGSSLTLNGGLINQTCADQTTNYGSLVKVENGATFTMNGGELRSNLKDRNFAIGCNETGDATVKGGIIDGYIRDGGDYFAANVSIPALVGDGLNLAQFIDDYTDLIDAESGYYKMAQGDEFYSVAKAYPVSLSINDEAVEATVTVGDTAVEEGDLLLAGDVVTVEAEPKDGYKNVACTINDKKETFEYTVQEDDEGVSIVVDATQIDYATLTIVKDAGVTLTVKDEEGKDVEDGAKFDKDNAETITVEWELAEHKKFVNGAPESSYEMTENVTIDATTTDVTSFDAPEVTEDGATGTILVNGVEYTEGKIWAGDVITIEGLEADEGYKNPGVLINNEEVPEDGYVVNDGDTALQINFIAEEKNYVTASVTFNGATADVSVEDGATVYEGTEVTVSNVQPAEDYKSAKCTINGADVDSITIDENTVELVIVVSATPIEYATLNVTGDEHISNINATVDNVQVDLPYRADADDEKVVTVTYEIEDGYELADDSLDYASPFVVTLKETKEITINTKLAAGLFTIPAAAMGSDLFVTEVDGDEIQPDENGKYPIVLGSAIVIKYMAHEGMMFDDPAVFIVASVNTQADIDAVVSAAPEAKTIIATIDDVNYSSFAAAFAAAQDGDTITLAVNTDEPGIVFAEDRFATDGLTIDLGGNTFTATTPVGSPGTVRQGMQILKGNKVTLKNGTITTDGGMASSFRMVIQNYADDLVLDSVMLDGSNLGYAATKYTLSNVNGAIVMDGTTKIVAAADEGSIAFDIDGKGQGPQGNFDYGPVSVTIRSNNVDIDGKIEIGRDKSMNENYETISFALPTLMVQFLHSQIVDGYPEEKRILTFEEIETWDGMSALKIAAEEPVTPADTDIEIIVETKFFPAGVDTPEAKAAYLAEEQDNGYPRWVNHALNNDAGVVLPEVTGIESTEDTATLGLNLEVTEISGLEAVSKVTIGEEGEASEGPIDLEAAAAAGLVQVDVFLRDAKGNEVPVAQKAITVAKEEIIEAELEDVKLITVPTGITHLNGLVNAGNLVAGDKLYGFDNATGGYYTWLWDGSAWKAPVMGIVSADAPVTPDPDNFELKKDMAFWLELAETETPRAKVFQLGGITAGGKQELSEGWNLVGVPGTVNTPNKKIADVVTNPSEDDQVIISIPGGAEVTYFLEAGVWYTKKSEVVNGRVKKTKVAEPEEGILAAGTGFWFVKGEGSEAEINL